MTATVAAPTLDSVLKRADGQYAKRAGDDPAPPEYIAALATAVRPLLEQGASAERGADLAELSRLHEESAARGRLLEDRAAEIAELTTKLERARSVGTGSVERLSRERDEARAERDTAKGQLRDAGPVPDGALEQLQADNARLADELARTRRDLAAANLTLDEIADDEAQQALAAPHRHRYPLDESSGKPLPCDCGQTHPRDPTAYEVEDIEPDVEPLAVLLSRIGAELTEAGWQW